MVGGRLILCSVITAIFVKQISFPCYKNVSCIPLHRCRSICWRSLNYIKCQGYQTTRIKFYSNSVATFQLSRIILSGDVSPNPGPTNSCQPTSVADHLHFRQLSDKGLKVCHLNVRSLPNHLDEIHALVLSNNFDLFLMSETWLNSTYDNSEIELDGYELHRYDRIHKSRGGGVAVYTKNSLISKRVTLLDNTCGSVEYVCLEVRQHHRGPKIIFIVLYRPPDSTMELYNHIAKLLECAACFCDEIIISGDFNIDLLKHANGRLPKIFKDAGMTQMVQSATREQNGISTNIN